MMSSVIMDQLSEEESDGAEEQRRREHTSTSEAAVTVPPSPFLLHFTAEELDTAPGIEEETFPEMSFIDESHSNFTSLHSSPSPQRSEQWEVQCPGTASVCPEQPRAETPVQTGPSARSVESDDEQPCCSQTKTNQTLKSSPEASHSGICSISTVRSELIESRPKTDRGWRTPMTKTDEVKESRNTPLTYRIPDFSKVNPKVRLPQTVYKPPVSRTPSLSSESAKMYMSPTDIVMEVLLNATATSPAPGDGQSPQVTAHRFNVPHEFRSRKQAITLLEQLQEEHNRLLTKFAEANNTIDHLRLKAKVNLYSEPPKPGHLVQAGWSHDASKVMTLEFPRVQRAEISSGSVQLDGRSPPLNPDVGEQLARILYTQADSLLKQLQNFEDLLKTQELNPSEQMMGLSQLSDGFKALERGYIVARDEHKLLQQSGKDVGHFDDKRELEGLLFRCEQHMEELKEQVRRMLEEQSTCETPPSPPPQPTPPSVYSEYGETMSLPQSPTAPLLVDPGRAAEEERPAIEDPYDEEPLNSQYFQPLLEQDFTILSDHYGSFQELPRTFDHELREAALPAGLESHKLPGDSETERQRTGNLDEHRSSEPPAGVSTQQSSGSSPSQPAASSPSSSLTVGQPSSGRSVSERGHYDSSSVSSLGETPAAETKNSKLQPGGSRALSQQDGIISPETDSGFFGVESCRLTPGPGPLHQGASLSCPSDLVHQDGSTWKPQTVSASTPLPSLIPQHTAAESGRASLLLGPEHKSRRRQRRRNYSKLPQRWVSQTESTTTDNGAKPESDSTQPVSEDGYTDQFTESSNSLSSTSSSSHSELCHHGDSLRGSSVVRKHKNAIKTLEAKVTRLEEGMHHLWIRKTPAPVKAAAPVQENHTHFYTSTPISSLLRPEERRQSNVRRQRRERRMADEVEDSTLRRAARETSPYVDARQPPDIFSDAGSDLELCAPQPQPRVSRCTQTFSASARSCCSQTHGVQSSETQTTAPPPTESIRVFNPAHEPDGRNHPLPVLCVECLSHLRGRAARKKSCPAGGSRGSTSSSTSSSSCHRSHSRCLQENRGTMTDSHRDSAPRTSCQSAESPDRAARKGDNAAPPTPLPPKCMLVGLPLFVSSQPIHRSPRNSTGTPSGVRGHKEARRRVRRSRLAEVHSSLDDSLDRAIRIAQDMNQTTKHMAGSLASGLQFQKQLTQFCRRRATVTH